MPVPFLAHLCRAKASVQQQDSDKQSGSGQLPEEEGRLATRPSLLSSGRGRPRSCAAYRGLLFP